MILYRGFLAEETEQIGSAILQAMQGGIAEKAVELIQGFDKGEPEKKQIFFLAVAKDQIDLRKKLSALPALLPNMAKPQAAEVRTTSPSRSIPTRNADDKSNPFTSTSIEDLRVPFAGRVRVMRLRFDKDAEPQSVDLPPKVVELVQYFDANWSRWTALEAKQNYNLLAEYFATVHSATLGKKWIPEGSASPNHHPTGNMAKDKADLMASWVPVV